MTGTSRPGSLYELLGVQPHAPPGEITRAYHRRARDLHPDTQPGAAGPAARFRELEAAYRVLRDPARRAAYDQGLRQTAPRPAPAPRRAAAWPTGRPPGAMLWAGPVQVTPPGASTPAPGPAGFWLAAPAYRPGWPW